ncbi:glutamic acid-rich protein-like isoform X2 [Aethina tumida]|nr:glutamic acid-rich protein-like isoform X2 [Aethina tumida]XP_049824872.1 glutamic acid-rich protein-like isoform X2 [Aethina tumida]
MPASGKTETSNGDAASNPAQRTTFRPPWVKEGPNPLPVPTQPWELKKAPRRDSSDSSTTDNPLGVTLRKVTVPTKESQENGEGTRDVTFEKPKLKPVPRKEIDIPKKNKIPLPKLNSITDATENNPLAGVQLRKTSIKTSEPQENGTKEPEFIKPKLKSVPVREKTPPKKDHKLQLPKLNSVADRKLKDPPRKPSLTRVPTNDDDLDKEVPATRNALVRAESMRRMSQVHIPHAPPMPPPAPLMPGEEPKKELSSQQKKRLEQLRSRPKVRPDWSCMLKEIEGVKKLRHVECNDRSQPLLPDAKDQTKDHFVFESEKGDNSHHELLREIQGGIKLKKVKTNDRSKPMLEGLRKFRRQMTIEEQIQKSMSMASIPPEEIPVEEQDEMDDIDKVRDDLQSTKQMLALELRNKEAQIRENKMLLARIQNLEAELEKEKARKAEGGDGGGGGGTQADDKIIKSLKTEAEQAKKHSEELEKKYKESAEELDSTKAQLEEMRRQHRDMEKKLQEAMQGKRMSFSDRKNSMANGADNSDLDFSSDEEEESDGEETEEKKEKRLQKELKHLRNKLRNFKNKEDNAKKERIALREIIKRNQTAIKEEKKKFKQLQKEVDKMAALMKDLAEEDEDENEDEEKPEEETEEESEEESSEEESSEEEDESDEEESESEAEDAPAEKRKANLESRNNRHESILSALKKGNFMLKANAERLQDELNKQKDATESLKHDLDSVLSELG